MSTYLKKKNYSRCPSTTFWNYTKCGKYKILNFYQKKINKNISFKENKLISGQSCGKDIQCQTTNGLTCVSNVCSYYLANFHVK